METPRLEEGLRLADADVAHCRDAWRRALSNRDRLIGLAREAGLTVRQIEALVGVTNARITQIGKEQAR